MMQGAGMWWMTNALVEEKQVVGEQAEGKGVVMGE